MNEDTNDTAEVEEVETEVEQDVPVKKTTKADTKERSQTQKAQRKEVDHEEEDKFRYASDELKRENGERRIENKALKLQIEKLTAQFETAKGDFETNRKVQENRVIRATLLSALSKAGCLDSEVAMTMLADQIKFDKHGDPENHESLVEDLKKNKSYFFTGPATTQTMPTPKASNRGVDVRNQSDEEFRLTLKNMGVKIP